MTTYYPAKLEPDGEGWLVTFPDIPEALTSGRTREEALEMAADALATAMDFYFEDRRAVPLPSELGPGLHAIELPVKVAAKVLLSRGWTAMNEPKPYDRPQYTVYGLLVSGSRFTDEYTEEDAIERYMELHPEADEAAVRTELKAEIAKHG